MRVLIVRHAAASDPHTCSSDAVRWLTPAGRISARRVGYALAEMGLVYTCIYTSPLVRAVQTAEILADTARFEGPLEVHEPLSADSGSTAQALAVLDRHGGDDVVVLVSHEPKVRGLAGHLAGRRGFPGFPTSGVALVSYDRRAGALEWILDPTSLERTTPPLG